MNTTTTRRGAIVLCGGRSTRMGRDKASLPFGTETMLQRVVRILNHDVGLEPIIVVAAPGQILPELPTSILRADDVQIGRGPLEGLAAGLSAVPSDVESVYVTGCDTPLLNPSFVRHLFDCLSDAEIAVPVDGSFFHPLAAVYRTSLLPLVRRLLAEDELRPRALMSRVAMRAVSLDELRLVDPQLLSLRNVNHPDEYQAALELAAKSGPVRPDLGT